VAMPPDFNENCLCRNSRSGIHAGDLSDTPSCFRNDNNRACEDPSEKHWQNNHSVSKHADWGSVAGQFPTITPVKENVTMKNAMFNTLTERAESNAGSWSDETDFYMARFEDIVPAAKLQASMATVSLDDISSDVFLFADMEILDANLSVIPRWAPNLNFTNHQRMQTRHLCFAVTVSPRLILPGAMNFDPSTFPTPTSNTVCVRALIQNGGLAPRISKNLLNITSKISISFYTQAGREFDASIKLWSDAALDQEKCSKWLRKIKSKTKFHACKHHIQQACAGRLEGTETLVQQLTSLRQRIVDPASQQIKHLLV
jgi:hypothetical protein